MLSPEWTHTVVDDIACITSSATWWRWDTDDTSGIALNNVALDNDNQQDDSIIAIDKITYFRKSCNCMRDRTETLILEYAVRSPRESSRTPSVLAASGAG
jgi:hypothetical protein